VRSVRVRATLVVAAFAVVLAVGCGTAGRAGQRMAAVAPAAAAKGPFVPNGPASSATLWAVGDGPAGPAAAAVGRLIESGRPGVVLYLGDVYPYGTAAAFANSYRPAFGRFARLTAPTPGNHDWPFRESGYDPYWQGVRGHPTPPWYSFTAGGWQLLSLNSEIGATDAQLRWLHARLRGRGDCRIAYWHRPRFSAGLHGDAGDMQPIWHALQGHASIVLSGHDHDMQRMLPRGGLVQYVSGAGGHSHYPVSRAYPGLAFADDSHWGALRVRLRPGRAQLDFIATSGRRLDSSRVSCAP